MVAKVGDLELVGQTKCISKIASWKERDSFPHFLLVVGDIGSGRNTLSYLFAQELDARVSTVPDVSVGSIRRLISIAYDIDSTMVYLIPNADGMSLAAKNSLLKLTEEPPENAYIILTLESLENTLPTLVSRSQHLILEPYTQAQLSMLTSNELISKIADTPGMVSLLESMTEAELSELVNTCDKLINYVDKVSIANALKSAQRLKFKESDKSNIDIPLFLSALTYVLTTYFQSPEMLTRVSAWLRAIGKHRPLFKRTGVNKKAVYDKLIVDIRSRLMM